MAKHVAFLLLTLGLLTPTLAPQVRAEDNPPEDIQKRRIRSLERLRGLRVKPINPDDPNAPATEEVGDEGGDAVPQGAPPVAPAMPPGATSGRTNASGQPVTGQPQAAEPEQDHAAANPVETPRPAATPPPRPKKGDKVHFEFDDKDLEAVIKQVARMTGRNFIFDKKDTRNKKVTIVSESPVTVLEAYQAFLSALEANGLTTVQSGPALIKIIARRDAVQTALDSRAGSDVPWNDAFVTRIIQLKNISVSDVQQIVSALVAKDGNATAFAPTNSYIITDSANNIRRLSKIIGELDRAGADLETAVVQVQYADAADMAQKIQQIYGEQGGKGGARGGGGAARLRAKPIEGGAGGGGGGAEGESGGGLSSVIPDERTNQLIIQAGKDTMASIKDLIAKLDVTVTGGESIHVYYLHNADAEELAGVLANLTQGGGNQQPTRNRGATNRPNFGVPGANPEGGPPEVQGSSNAVATLLSGEAKVTADKANNALIIVASRSDYDVLRLVIDKLDRRRRQVFVEAVIAEISTDNDRRLGVSYNVAAAAGDGLVGLGGLNPATFAPQDPAALAGLLGSGGLTVGVINADPVTFSLGATEVTLPGFGIILQALENDSDVNVLSKPAVIATENEEAEFISATSVAFQGGTTISQTGLQNFSISKEDVGITLKVTPKINEDEYVTLELFQEVKDIAADKTTAQGQRLIDTGKRSAKTTVIVKDGQTIAIGGLMKNDRRISEAKIPILGDLPFIGWLFRNTSNSKRRQNLVIFITPTVVADDLDMQEIYKRKLEEKALFEKLYAAHVPKKEQRNRDRLFDVYHNAGPAGPAPAPTAPIPPATLEPVKLGAPTEVKEETTTVDLDGPEPPAPAPESEGSEEGDPSEDELP